MRGGCVMATACKRMSFRYIKKWCRDVGCKKGGMGEVQ